MDIGRETFTGYIKSFARGAVVSGLSAILEMYGVQFAFVHIELTFTILLLLLLALILVAIVKAARRRWEWRQIFVLRIQHFYRGPYEDKIWTYLCTLLIVIICFLIPATAMQYYEFDPRGCKRFIELTVLFVSIVSSIIYYIPNRKKFPGPAAKASYFAAVIGTPVFIIRILL